MLGINREACQPAGNTIGTAGHLSFGAGIFVIFIMHGSNKSEGQTFNQLGGKSTLNRVEVVLTTKGLWVSQTQLLVGV